MTKKLFRICGIIMGIIVLSVMSSCKGSGGSFTGSGKKPLNISVVAENNSIKFTKRSNASRTIYADPFEAEELTFYLWGKAGDEDLAPKEVEVTSEDQVTGKVILDLEENYWELTLAACDSDDEPSSLTKDAIMAKAVLIGYSNVDMTYMNSVKFYLSPNGLSKTGTVNITLALETGATIPSGYSAKVSIYDITTGKPIANGIDMTFEHDDIDGAVYDANDVALKPGNYSFQIDFTSNDSIITYSRNETIIILPGRELETTYTIRKLGEKPEDPDAFTVAFNTYGTSDSNEEFENTVRSNRYTAHFSWDGEDVLTEKNFAIELVELADACTIAAAVGQAKFDEIIADNTLYNKIYTFNFGNSNESNPDFVNFYRSGSLYANSSYIDMYLELGKRYIARLYSENYFGYSENASYVVIEPVENEAVMYTINRFKVEYDLAQGKWNKGENFGAEVYADNKIVEYWSQSTNKPYSVYRPIKDENTGKGTANNPYLYKGANGAFDWIYWTQNGTSTKYPVIANDNPALQPYTDYKNLYLLAHFEEGTIEIHDDSNFDIVNAWVTAFGVSPFDNTNTVTIAKSSLTSTDPTYTTIELTIPDDDSVYGSWIYEYVELETNGTSIIQEGEARGDSNVFQINYKKMSPGYYYYVLKGTYGGRTYTYPINIKLTD